MEARLKSCNACKKELLFDSFCKDVAKKDGKHGTCGPCSNEKREARKAKNPGKFKAQQLKSNHRSDYKRKYGITVEQYEMMAEAQDNLCAICNQPETAKWKGVVKRLAVDHCHESNEVRGLLCMRCNIGIGMFEDDITYLKSATEYLSGGV